MSPCYDVVALDPRQPWDGASAACRLDLLAPTLPFRVGDARLVPSNDNDVWRLGTGYLRLAWRGDRTQLAREARLLRGSLPVPEVVDCGGDDRLSWSLTAELPGTTVDRRSSGPTARGIAREIATLLRALRCWPVPPDLARPEADADPLRRVGTAAGFGRS